MAYPTSRASFARFSGAVSQPPLLADLDGSDEPPPQVPWLRRLVLSTFVVLVVFASAAFLVYALAHGGGLPGEIARSLLRAVGVPEPPAPGLDGTAPNRPPATGVNAAAQVVRLELGAAEAEFDKAEVVELRY